MKQTNILLNPFVSYYLPCVTSLLLYYLGLSDLFTSGALITSVFVIAIILTVPLSLMGISIYLNITCNEHKNTKVLIDFSIDKLIKWLLLISGSAYLVQLYLLGLPPLFVAQNKTLYFVFGISLLFYSVALLSVLSAVGYAISRKLVYLFYFSIGLLMLITLLNKNPIVLYLLTAFYGYTSIKRVPLKKMILSLFLILSLLLLVVYQAFSKNPAFLLSVGYFENLSAEFGTDQHFSDPILAIIYMYIASGWENLFNYVAYYDCRTYGTMFFSPIVKLLKLDALNETFVYKDYLIDTLKNDHLAVGTGFFRMYSDFGYSSLMLYIFLYMAIALYFYYKYIRHRRLSDLIVLIQINVFLVFLFFDNYFYLTISMFNIILFYSFVRLPAMIDKFFSVLSRRSPLGH